ncbi:hypothetical protein K435DRAFT_865464 [Dendrothele bispora CBS 962.96]|uniref:Uncharacterized protein n=1 Tax=Dendrothele bispora (strain CBS 962.96) TaxID=1314807 RepID=A0A4S8LJD4_DENBC|nr:hypothetical protein K435DRAFT_865464 [Dendrothele bispora CBS 962.96]
MPSANSNPPPYELTKTEDDYIVVQEKVQKTIDDAAKDTPTSVEECFRRVSQRLDEAQEASIEFRPSIITFSDDWTGYHNRYHELLQGFAETGKAARKAAESFDLDLVDTIKNSKASLPEKREKIRGYQEQLKGFQEKSQKLSQDFVELQGQVTLYQDNLTRWAKETDIDELNRDIERISRKIQDLHTDIENLQNRFTGLFTVFGAAYVRSKLKKKRGYLILEMYRVLNLPVTHDLTTEHKNQREEQQQMLQGKRNAVNSLLKIQAIVQSLGDDMNAIRGCLVTFSEVWAFMHADLVEIDQKVELANTSQGKVLFQRRLESVESLNRSLKIALRQHEDKVEKEEIFTENAS